METHFDDIFLFEDERSMSNTTEISYKWTKKGKQPAIKQKKGRRKKITFFRSVNPISCEVIVSKVNKGNPKTFK